MSHSLANYMESECDMAKYFMSSLIYFHEPEESEVSSHITLTSMVYSTLFIFTAVVSTRVGNSV